MHPLNPPWMSPAGVHFSDFWKTVLSGQNNCLQQIFDATDPKTMVASVFVEKHFKEALPQIPLLIHIALLPLLSNVAKIFVAEITFLVHCLFQSRKTLFIDFWDSQAQLLVKHKSIQTPCYWDYVCKWHYFARPVVAHEIRTQRQPVFWEPAFL